MKHLLFILPPALPGLAALGPLAAPPAPYRLERSMPIGGTGGWDFLTTDPTGERLYVTHGNQLEVLDLRPHKLPGTVPGNLMRRQAGRVRCWPCFPAGQAWSSELIGAVPTGSSSSLSEGGLGLRRLVFNFPGAALALRAVLADS